MSSKAPNFLVVLFLGAGCLDPASIHVDAGPTTPVWTGDCGCANPASAYCEQHGGRLTIETGPAGQYGLCHFADNSQCDEWAFYVGACAPGQVLHPPCSAPARAPTDQGDTLLCRPPPVVCDPVTEVLSVQECHFPPSPNPTTVCCDARPEQCSPTDCDCLLRHGPWVDSFIAADAGSSLADWPGPQLKCSYRVSCTPATDGGAAVLSCNPA